MERLTEMYGGMIVPRKACTFDREGGADDCKECTEICEDEGGVCRTCILQECLTRLWDYEGAGLTPEQIMELKEQDVAKVAVEVDVQPYFRKHFAKQYTCPKCHSRTQGEDRFCRYCGQRLKWEDRL